MYRFYNGKTSNLEARSTAQPNRNVLDEYRRFTVYKEMEVNLYDAKSD